MRLSTLTSHTARLTPVLILLRDETTGEHGTLDYSIGSSPIQDARRLKIRIDGGQTHLQAPAYTAESYAGAATGTVSILTSGQQWRNRSVTNYGSTELWFQTICKVPFIAPETGY